MILIKKRLSLVLSFMLIFAVFTTGFGEELPQPEKQHGVQFTAEPNVASEPSPDQVPKGSIDPEDDGELEAELPPTAEPTEAPTEAPTETPTEAPTEELTQAPTQEPTQIPSEEPAQELPEPPAAIDYAKSVHENPLFVSGYVQVLEENATVSQKPWDEPLYSLPKDAVLYLLSWGPDEETSFAQVLFPSDAGEWHIFCMDASFLRPMKDDEVSAFIQGLQSPQFFIEDDMDRPLLPVALTPLLEQMSALPSLEPKTMRVEPLWEGGFPEALGDDVLLDARNPEGLPLRNAFSDAFSAHAPELDLSGYGLTDVQIQSALQAFLDENLSFFHVSGDFTTESQEGLVRLLHPKYRMDAQQWNQSKAAQQSAIAALLSIPARENSALGHIVSLHDLFCEKYAYADGSGQYDAFALFTQGQGESQAVSMALHAALQALHIPSLIVRSEEMGHVWNMVQLNGNWYHVDISLDMAGSYRAFILYDYLLLSEKALGTRSANHRNWFPGKAANDTTYDEFDFVRFGYPLEDSMDLFQAGAFPTTVEKVTGPSLLRAATFESTVDSAIRQGATSIDLRAFNLTPAQLKTEFQNLINMRPEFFYLDNYYYYYITGSGLVTYLEPRYIYTGQDRENKIRDFDARVQAILNTVPTGVSDLEKALYLNDFLAIHYEYDLSLTIYDAYNMMVEKKGVCQSYALLYQYLLTQNGVSSKLASSEAMNHAWNVVQIGGGWYHVDVTWNDPVWNTEGYVDHQFFLLSDQAMRSGRSSAHYGWDITTNAISTQYDNYFWKNITRPFSYGNGGWYYGRLQNGTGTNQIVRWEKASNKHTVVHTFADVWAGENMSSAADSFFGVAAYGDRLLFNKSQGVFFVPIHGGAEEQLAVTRTTSLKLYGVFQKEGNYYFTEASSSYAMRTARLISRRLLRGTTEQERQILAFIDRLYLNVLHRTATDDDVDFWFDVLITQRDSGAGVSAGFLLSEEFISKNLSDENFVEILYLTCMNRPSDADGKAFWLGKLQNGGTRAGVVKLFLESPEYTSLCASYGILRGDLKLPDPADHNVDLTMFIYRLYKILLDREPEKGGPSFWANALLYQGISGKEVAHGFVFSPEFQGKNFDTETYVRYLYRALLGREPDPEGLAFQVAAVNQKGRVLIYDNFVNSPEFRSIMDAYGVR